MGPEIVYDGTLVPRARNYVKCNHLKLKFKNLYCEIFLNVNSKWTAKIELYGLTSPSELTKRVGIEQI